MIQMQLRQADRPLRWNPCNPETLGITEDSISILLQSQSALHELSHASAIVLGVSWDSLAESRLKVGSFQIRLGRMLWLGATSYST